MSKNKYMTALIGGQRLKCQGDVNFLRLLHTESTLLNAGLKKFGGDELIVFITKFLAFEGRGEGYFCAPGAVG